MKTYVQEGAVLDHVASGAISSGAVVLIGSMGGVAIADIADGETGAVLVEGVVSLAKNTSTSMAVGDIPYWDLSAGQLAAGTPATGDVNKALMVIEAAASADATVKVKLMPSASATTT